MNRKEFISSLGRVGLLSGMAILVVALVGRQKITLESECSNDGICSNCSKLKSCSLPGAEKQRSHGER